VSRLVDVLRAPTLERLVYLSSARVYGLAGGHAMDERTPIAVDTADPGAVYDVTKLAGEAVALAAPVPAHCLRLTHVFPDRAGSPNFLASVLRDAAAGHVQLHSSLESAKDYVALDDVVTAILRVCDGDAATGVYNIGSGTLVTHGELMDALHAATGCTYAVDDGAPTLRYPVIDCTRMREELGIEPAPFLPAVPSLVSEPA
jgi:nucleoside-diphosphate-sugar epimerase